MNPTPEYWDYEELWGSDSANDRFKESFGAWFAGSLIVATLLHVCLFQFSPEMTAQDVSYAAEELIAVEMPPEIHRRISWDCGLPMIMMIKEI